MTVEEQVVDVVSGKYKFQRPSDEDFAQAQFTGGDPVKKAVARLFDRLEGKLDAEKVARLQEAFDRGVDIWAQAGLFSKEREEAGYLKPDFKRDYQPLLTQDNMDMAEDGEALNKGYSTPVFAPMDVPLHNNENADRLSYFKLLGKALLKAFKGTAGGKEPNTLLIGPEKRVLTANRVNLEEILWKWERYLKVGVVHNVQKLDPKEHSGVSEQALLAGLTGNERRTGGVMRIERDQLIMPCDIGETEMSALDWESELPDILPPNADVQDLKQAIAHVIYCLEMQGWMPDYFDYKSPETSRVNLVLKSFVPDEGQKGGVVPALRWVVAYGQFGVGRGSAVSHRSDFGVRAGVRMC